MWTRFLLALVAAALIVSPACARKPAPRARAVQPEIVRDVPAALRGTIGAEASLTGRAAPILISGFGLVVGLPGTGGGDLPPRIAATMERQLGQMQMTRSSDALTGTIFEGKTPAQILRMKEVAVVIVYSQVVPGAPDGVEFDVYVTSINKGPDISLEGGWLYTTDLHPGPPSTFGSVTTRPIAKARGQIFINPFAGSSTGPSRMDGRILGGGTIVNSMNLELVLDNESHSRAASIVSAINNRFPPGPGGEPVARGRTARIIHITVPSAFREEAETFLRTLEHIQIQQGSPQEFAKRYIAAMKSQPSLADSMSWCLQALPQRAAVPFLRELYDSSEVRVRWAALRAGAALSDPLAAPMLKQMAQEGPASSRAEAVRLLGKLSAGPTVDTALRDQLDAKELTVRIAAYEALVDRAESVQRRRLREHIQSLPPAVRVARVVDESLATNRILELSGESLQGIRRRVIAGKFILDIVPSGDPLLYITQRGRPRLVIFGEKLELRRPTMVSTWNDRLMLLADSPTDDPRIFYKWPDRVDEFGDVIPGRAVVGKAPVDVAALAEFLAHSPSIEDPRPGLGLTYSEVVGALYAFQTGRAIPAAFAVEEDYEQARLFAQSNEAQVEDRPDTRKDAAAVRVYEAPTDKPAPAAPTTPESMVVPLPQPTKK
ncbi:MAG: flagellar basal body P-ring protein FlgI [Phycisphaeraceae bacterium]|nr:flagellar basal body P-ring protein FlgI [Phycisphaeraceae bacterium]